MESSLAKYDPLSAHLRRQKTQTYEMSFADIERVIHVMLPKSATRSEWWGNETSPQTRHVQCKAWLSSGFNASLQPSRDRVCFTRG